MIALNTIVHNEADRIVGLLEHAGIYCDELVVVDQDSEDGTADLAREFGALVLRDICHGSNEPSRQLADEHTRAKWILSLDADEVLNDHAVTVLPAIIECADAAAFLRVNRINGVQVGPYPDWHVRFFQRGKVRFDPKLHGRIWPDSDEVFRSEAVQIIHAKTRAEQDLDDVRYEMLSHAVPQR